MPGFLARRSTDETTRTANWILWTFGCLVPIIDVNQHAGAGRLPTTIQANIKRLRRSQRFCAVDHVVYCGTLVYDLLFCPAGFQTQDR